MDSPLAQYLRSELKARGKSLYFLAEFTGLDIRYLHRLTTGQKRNPSAETLVKIAFALVLSELLLAAGYTAVAAAPRL
jgi:transcriptional regulator with XRE-family HTH domain